MARNPLVWGSMFFLSLYTCIFSVQYFPTQVRYERMFEPDVCSNLLRLVCGEKKRSEEIESMVESFCRGKRQRQSEVGAPTDSIGKWIVCFGTSKHVGKPSRRRDVLKPDFVAFCLEQYKGSLCPCARCACSGFSRVQTGSVWWFDSWNGQSPASLCEGQGRTAQIYVWACCIKTRHHPNVTLGLMRGFMCSLVVRLTQCVHVLIILSQSNLE